MRAWTRTPSLSNWPHSLPRGALAAIPKSRRMRDVSSKSHCEEKHVWEGGRGGRGGREGGERGKGGREERGGREGGRERERKEGRMNDALQEEDELHVQHTCIESTVVEL